MQPIVKEDIISALDEAYKAFVKFDIPKLSRVSNFTIHNAGIFQDHDSVTFAVLIYSLAKVCTRERESEYLGWKQFKGQVEFFLAEAKHALERGNHDDYSKVIRRMFQLIGHLDRKLTKYATEVVEQARIKKGGKVYEHGISSGRAAELMGITEWELMSYAGLTGISERIDATMPIEQRMRIAKKIFKIK